MGRRRDANQPGPNPTPGVTAFGRPLAAISALLILAALVAYVPALRAGFIWDDDSYVTENVELRDLPGLGRIWFQPSATPQYYPLVHTSFWIERHLWGTSPFGYHLINVLLHGLSAVLLWRILVLLRIPGALFAAAVFALHPVHVESVAWVTERKNVLSGAFYLGSALAFLRQALRSGPPVRKGARAHPFLLPVILFACALLSKTVTATLPVALLLVLWWKRGTVRKEHWTRLAPMLAIGLLMGLLTAWVEKHQVGAAGEEWRLTFMERNLIAGRAICFYAGKLLWPTNLTFTYPRWEIDASAIGQYLFPFAVAVAVAVLWALRGRIGRGALVALLYFIVTLGPALGYLDVYPFRYSFVADHFQYLASIGPIALGVAAVDRAMKMFNRGAASFSDPGIERPSIRVGGIALCVLLGVLTWRQGRIYRDQESLWTDTIMKNPAAWMAHNNLGRIYLLRQDLDSAIRHFDSALAAKGDYFEAFLNRGNARKKKGETEAAIADYGRAAALDPRDPAPHFNTGNAHLSLGRLNSAIESYDRAISLGMEEVGVYLNRGTARLNGGELEPAIADFSRAIALRRDAPEAYHSRAIAFFNLKEYDRAWADVRECRLVGGEPDSRFIADLTAASGRDR